MLTADFLQYWHGLHFLPRAAKPGPQTGRDWTM